VARTVAQPLWTLLASCIAIFMLLLDVTIVNVVPSPPPEPFIWPSDHAGMVVMLATGSYGRHTPIGFGERHSRPGPRGSGRRLPPLSHRPL